MQQMSDSIKVGTTVKVSENGDEAVVIKAVADQMPWCENVEFPDGSTAILRREPMVVVRGPAKKAAAPKDQVPTPEPHPDYTADDPGSPL
jgi:hypothetical protein